MPEASLDEHERRVEEDRAALAESLDRLSDTLSPERLKSEAASAAQEYGSEIQRQIWGVARENPAGFALVGVGLALLLSGGGRRPEDHASVTHHDDSRAGGGSVRSDAAAESHTAAKGAMDAAHREKGRWRPSARRLRSALDRGLDRLPPKARAKVRQARLAAIRAQEDVEHRASRLASRADRAVHERPVTAAAAAFGVGALVAAFLPASQREDKAMGAHRDRLMDEAQAAFEREIDALQAQMTRSGTGGEQRPEGPFEVPS